MKKAISYLLQLVTILLVSACATPKITQLSPDTYQITMTDSRGVFGNWSEARENTLKEAQNFANAKNMKLVPISINEKPMRPGQFYSIDYKFRLIDPYKSGVNIDYSQVAPEKNLIQPSAVASVKSQEKSRDLGKQKKSAESTKYYQEGQGFEWGDLKIVPTSK